MASFKLPAQQLKSFFDVQLNFDKLLSLYAALRLETPFIPGATGRHPIGFGIQNMVWTASAVAAAATVTHGLGQTPLGCTYGLTGKVVDADVFFDSFTATTFRMQANEINGNVISSTQPVFWVAYG